MTEEIETCLRAEGLTIMADAHTEYVDSQLVEMDGKIVLTKEAAKRIQWFALQIAIDARKLEQQIADELDPEGAAERLSTEILQQFDHVVELADRMPDNVLREPANDRA